jgi:hypothetical protein
MPETERREHRRGTAAVTWPHDVLRGKTNNVSSGIIPIRGERPPFTPAGAVTGIGSLPFTSAASAILAVAEFSPEVPFWPQLPQLSERERFIGQGLGILTGSIEPRSDGYGYQVKDGQIDAVLEALHRSTGELSQENAVGFCAFEEAFSLQYFMQAIAVKGQIAGPITLSTYLGHQGKSFLADPALFAAIAFHVSQMVRWQTDRLKSAGLPVLMFVDEPALCLEGAGYINEETRLSALEATLQEARSCGAYAGLHCCAVRPFERMYRAKPDILSFDADEGLELFFAGSDARNFLNRGGMVGYGIVPTGSTSDSASIFSRWLQAASQAGDLQQFSGSALITATCGLGLLDVSAVKESFEVAHGVSKLIRGLVG